MLYVTQEAIFVNPVLRKEVESGQSIDNVNSSKLRLVGLGQFSIKNYTQHDLWHLYSTTPVPIY